MVMVSLHLQMFNMMLLSGIVLVHLIFIKVSKTFDIRVILRLLKAAKWVTIITLATKLDFFGRRWILRGALRRALFTVKEFDN